MFLNNNNNKKKHKGNFFELRCFMNLRPSLKSGSLASDVFLTSDSWCSSGASHEVSSGEPKMAAMVRRVMRLVLVNPRWLPWLGES